MKKITVLRKILRERGYLVLWQGAFHPPFRVGNVIAQCGGEGFSLGLMKVRKQTTESDFLAQQVLSKKIAPAHWQGSPTAIVKEKRRFNPTFWRVTRTKIRG